MIYNQYNFFSEEFENQLQERIQIINEKYRDLIVPLTSNPLVDVGIYAVAILKKKSYNDVNIGDVLDTILNIDGMQSQGKAFVHRNFRTKAISKVLINNPLIQGSYGGINKKGYKKSPSKAEPSPLQERIYRVYLIEFLISHGEDQEAKVKPNSQCMFCGNYTKFDFNELETVIKALAGNKNPINKDIFGSGPTRTWMPLLGTTSAIQALPGFAEPNVVCGNCLVLSQFLPQLADLQNGLLTVYQSNNHSLVMDFYRINIKNFEENHRNTPNRIKLEIIGSDSSDYYINNLLTIIRDNYKELANSNLILWKFDNYGTGPTMEYIHLPNTTLNFLFEIIEKYDGEKIIRNFIRYEEENEFKSSFRLFNCIEAREDYILFYPHTKYEIEKQIPQVFFELYQISIRKWNPISITTVRKIAMFIKKMNNEVQNSELHKILKQRNISLLRNFIVPRIIEYVQEEKVNVNHLLTLFEDQDEIVLNRNPWKLFQYYLHPKLNIIETKISSRNNNLNFDKYRIENLSIIQDVANHMLKIEKNRSSFNYENYINNLSTIKFSNFRAFYIITGIENPELTWYNLERMEAYLYRYEILFYFRLFSVKNIDTLKIKVKFPTMRCLKKESGLNSVLIDVLIFYIEKRIEETNESRIYNELDKDLRYNKYSAIQFYNILLNKIIGLEYETEFSEYHFYIYELENNSNFRPKIENQNITTFSWMRLKGKIRLFINQYQAIKKLTLEKQIKEIKL